MWRKNYLMNLKVDDYIYVIDIYVCIYIFVYIHIEIFDELKGG
jgi:hypothetical protein